MNQEQKYTPPISTDEEASENPRAVLEQARLVLEQLQTGIQEKMRSTSIGDILVQADGTQHIIITAPYSTGTKGEFGAFIVSRGGSVKRISEKNAAQPYVDVIETPKLSDTITFEEIQKGDILVSGSGTIRIVLEKHPNAIVSRRVQGPDNITTETASREKLKTNAIAKVIKAE